MTGLVLMQSLNMHTFFILQYILIMLIMDLYQGDFVAAIAKHTRDMTLYDIVWKASTKE